MHARSVARLMISRLGFLSSRAVKLHSKVHPAIFAYARLWRNRQVERDTARRMLPFFSRARARAKLHASCSARTRARVQMPAE